MPLSSAVVQSSALTAAVLLFASGGNSLTSRSDAIVSRDPPLLVPWTRAGDFVLGARESVIESEYGLPGHGYHVQTRDNGIVEGYFVLHGSRIFVTFEDGRLNELDFSSRYYRTKTGFGVGSRIPLGACHRVGGNSCQQRWHGFLWNAWTRQAPCNCWVKVGLESESLPVTAANFGKPWFFIYTKDGRASRFHLALKFVD